MTRTLLILRHAKSAWDTDAATDFDRPLNKRGRKDAPRVGAWLCKQDLVPDYVISSPAKRARQTACKVCKELGIDRSRIKWDERVYEADVRDLLQVLTDCPKAAQTTLLVGHNPGLEELIVYLSEGRMPVVEDGKLLPTASVAHMELSEAWNRLQPGVARLVSITRPRSLPAV